MKTAYSVPFVSILDVTVAVVRVDKQRKKRRLISGAASKSPLVCTVQFVLFVGMAVKTWSWTWWRRRCGFS